MGYLIHNTVRSRHNRTLRAANPGRHELKQFVGGKHRVIRGRPVHLNEEEFALHYEEIRAKVKSGALEVRTTDGRLVDIDTGATAPLAAPAPLPNPPLDSIANDKPAGYAMPQYPDGEPELPPGGPSIPSLVAAAPRDEEEEVPEASEEASTEEGEVEQPVQEEGTL